MRVPDQADVKQTALFVQIFSSSLLCLFAVVHTVDLSRSRMKLGKCIELCSFIITAAYHLKSH